jgi:hypothetical protein
MVAWSAASRRILWRGLLGVVLLGRTGAAASAQPAAPSPAPSPTAAPVWHNPPNTNLSTFDPCGGPKELLNKFGPTPCVYISGEAMVSAGYSNISAHGSVSASHGALDASLPLSGNANVYPGLFLVFGVSPSSQLQITTPSEVSVSTARLGAFSAASDTSFNYKQRVFFSPTAFTQLAVDLGYTAPTNGGGITSPGPAYQIQLDLAQPLNANLSVGPWWTFKNSVSTSLTGAGTRSWSDPLGIWFAWSPQNSTFEVLPVVYHSFNPNRTALIGQVVQLLNRHLSVAITYGGTETSTQSNGPFAQSFNFAANSYPRIFGVNFYYLINESNLPPQPPPPPKPQPTP